MKLKITFFIVVFFFSNFIISQTENLNASTVYTGMTWNQIVGPQEYIQKFTTNNTDNIENIFNYPIGIIRTFCGGAIDPINPNHVFYISYIKANNQYILSLFNLATNIDTQLGILNYTNWKGLEFDPTSEVLYAITDNALYTIDYISATSNYIGETGITATSLAIDGNGDMFSCDINDDNFYSLDKTTGASTIIGPLGFDVKRGGMAWDSNTDNIYLTSVSQYNNFSDFRIIDKNSGSSSLIGLLYGGFEYNFTHYDWISFDGSALGLDDFINMSFEIFPNPTNNTLNIQSQSLIENVKIYSIQGVLIGEYSSNEIDVSQLNSGLYFVKIYSEGLIVSKKFIKK